MGMGLSRPSTMTPMFSTCPCTAMTMGTSSREVEHQMRYVECVKFWGHLGGHASLEPGATAIWRAGQMQATPDCHSRKCYPRLCWVHQNFIQCSVRIYTSFLVPFRARKHKELLYCSSRTPASLYLVMPFPTAVFSGHP